MIGALRDTALAGKRLPSFFQLPGIVGAWDMRYRVESDQAADFIAGDRTHLEEADHADIRLAAGKIVSGWVRFASIGADQTILQQGDTRLFYSVQTGTIHLTHGEQEIALGSPMSGTWYLLTLWADEDGFVFGAMDNGAAVGGTWAITPGAGALSLGGSAAGDYLGGRLDSLFVLQPTIWSAELLSEIRGRLWNAGDGLTPDQVTAAERSDWGGLRAYALSEARGNRFCSWSPYALTEQFAEIIGGSRRNGDFEAVDYAANRITGDSANFDGGTIGSWAKAVVIKNRILWTDAFDNAVWSKRGTAAVVANDTTDPDGELTADKLTIDDGTNDIYQSVTGLTAGARYEPSFWIKQIDLSGVLRLYNPAHSANGHWDIDLSLLSGSWERIKRDHPAVTVVVEFTATSAGACGVHFRMATAGAKSFHAWRAQLEPGTVTTGDVKVEDAHPEPAVTHKMGNRLLNTEEQHATAGSTATMANGGTITYRVETSSDKEWSRLEGTHASYSFHKRIYNTSDHGAYTGSIDVRLESGLGGYCKVDIVAFYADSTYTAASSADQFVNLSSVPLRISASVTTDSAKTLSKIEVRVVTGKDGGGVAVLYSGWQLEEGQSASDYVKVGATATTVGGLGLNMVENAYNGIYLPTTGMTAETGKLYRVRFRHRLLSGAGDQLVVKNQLSAAYFSFRDSGSQNFVPDVAWQQFEAQVFCNSAGGLYIQQSDTGNGSTYEFDDFQLQEITIPNWTFLISGGSWFVTEDAASGIYALNTRHGTEAGHYAIAVSDFAPTVGKEYAITAQAKRVGTTNARLQLGSDASAGNVTTDTIYSAVTRSGRANAANFWLSRQTGGADNELFYDAVTLKAAGLLSAPGITAGIARDNYPISRVRPRAGAVDLAQASFAAQGVWREAGIGGLPAASLDGLDDYFASDFLAADGAPGFTFWVVFRTSGDVSTSQTLAHNYATGGGYGWGARITAGEIAAGYYDGTAYDASKSRTGAAADTDYLLIYRYAGAGVSTYRLNGLASDGTTSPSLAGAGVFALGARGDGGQPFGGRIAAFGATDRPITDREIRRIEEELGNRYGIAIA